MPPPTTRRVKNIQAGVIGVSVDELIRAAQNREY